MDSNKPKDTARFQLDRFLNSEESYSYPLELSHISLLNSIAYFIDLEKGGRNVCMAKQSTLATRARMTRPKANPAIHQLEKWGLINTERHWKLLWISWGENLIKSPEVTGSSHLRELDQVTSGDRTIETKKKKRRDREHYIRSECFSVDKSKTKAVFLEENEETSKVDNFMYNLFIGEINT